MEGFPAPPPLPVISYVAGASALRHLNMRIALTISQNAVTYAHLNWWFVMNTLLAFKVQGAYRKAVIKKLAENLARPIQPGGNGMVDLYGKSVFEGAKKTFEYNLSESHRSLGPYSIEIKNSLQSGQCHDQKYWLPDIPVLIAPIYGDMPLGGRPGGFKIKPRWFYEEPTNYGNHPAGPVVMNHVDPSPNPVLRGYNRVFKNEKDLGAVMGFEKNPWCMVYNYAVGKSVSNPLFSPSAEGIYMEAHAYSKPFGGRIGPWHSKKWLSGNSKSSGDPNFSVISSS